jgi:hypothetical protein
MTKKTLEIQVVFNNATYVSAEDVPEKIAIRINDPSLFVSEQGLPIET